MTAPLDWETFVSRFDPGSARHDFRVLKAYDAYRKSLRAEQSTDRKTEALRVWEEEGGAAQAVTTGSRRRTRDAASSQLDGVHCPRPAVVDPGSSS
jgi:hypothetical protein